MNVTRPLFILILAVFLSSPLFAQTSRYLHGFRTLYPGSATIGFHGGANYEFSASGPTNSVTGDSFDEGDGFGYHAGITLDFFVNRMMAIRVSSAYRVANAEYAETSTVTGYRQDGSAVAVDVDHRIATDPTYIDVALEIVWYTGPHGLYLLVGPDVGFLLGGTLTETQTIVEEGYIFNSGSSRIVLRDGNIKDLETAKARIGARAGIGYDLALSRTAVLAPELSLSYPFTSVTKESDDWKLVVAQFSVLFRFGL